MDAQERAYRAHQKMKRALLFIILGLVGIYALMFIGFTAYRYVKGADSRAAKALFESQELTLSDDRAVVKRPFTLYSRGNDRQWKYRDHVYDTVLVTDEGLTEKVKEARTCIFVWADVSDSKKSDEYVWASGNTKVKDAYFCPVYMTVVDREDGIRYGDIKIGAVPLSDTVRGKYSGSLYRTGDGSFYTLDLDTWAGTHWE